MHATVLYHNYAWMLKLVKVHLSIPLPLLSSLVLTYKTHPVLDIHILYLSQSENTVLKYKKRSCIQNLP